jgi:hypothetical protein
MSLRVRFTSPLLVFALALPACGGATTGVDDRTPPEPSAPGSGEGTGVEPGGPGSPPRPGAPPAAGGPEVTVAARGVSTPFAHGDGLSGATAAQQVVAVRSLHLLRTADDPAPLEVFDLGSEAVEVDYATGDTVEIATVPIATLPAGRYTTAKVGIAYVRYRVPARMHTAMGSYDGQYRNVQALSEEAKVDGQIRTRGWFRYAFAIGGSETGALEGSDAPLPALPTTGGIRLDVTGPVAFYVFPVELTVDPAVASDMLALFEANVFESFRWQDLPAAGYTTGIFDTTPASFEPVKAFGANSFSVTYSAH